MIDIFIYQSYDKTTIIRLNSLNKTKIIYYDHSCIFIWFYKKKYSVFNKTYSEYINSKFVISLIPFQNDFLFKKWGIKSILMNNFMTYEYYLIIPSNLYFKTILLVGRANDKYKRFELGLLAFEYIYQNIPESKMIIISSLNETSFLSELEENLNSNNIENPGYVSELEQFYKNASLHIIPSISESFSMVLCETKIYGIPNILLGLEYLSASSGGTIIIYDDTPESLAKEAIKILKDTNYRKFLGEQARINIQKFNNQKLLERWTKLLLSIYNSKNYYQKMIKEDKKISKKSAINIIKNEVNLIRKREKKLLNMTFYDILNLSYLKNIK